MPGLYCRDRQKTWNKTWASYPDCLFLFSVLFFFFKFSSQLLVQFVQNASIPLVQGLEDSDSKHSCLPLLAPAESPLCSPLELTGQQLLPALVLSNIGQNTNTGIVSHLIFSVTTCHTIPRDYFFSLLFSNAISFCCKPHVWHHCQFSIRITGLGVRVSQSVLFMVKVSFTAFLCPFNRCLS